MEKGNLANLVKEIERDLFRANKELEELSKSAKKAEAVLEKISFAEHSIEKKVALSKELEKTMSEGKVIAQANQLFKNLEILRKDLEKLPGLEEKARLFVERFRTTRLYSFEHSSSATNFTKQAFEIFSLQEILFKPRFIGPLNISDMAERLKVKKVKEGLLLQPNDLEAFVGYLLEKRFASNISLEADGLKLVWHDRKTIDVFASSEKLYRLNRLCVSLEGKCLEQ